MPAATTSTLPPCSAIALVLQRMHEVSPLRGSVRIIFQPAEETMPGGAT